MGFLHPGGNVVLLGARLGRDMAVPGGPSSLHAPSLRSLCGDGTRGCLWGRRLVFPTCGSSYLPVGYLQPPDGIGQYGAAVWLTKVPLAGQGKMNSDFVGNWYIIGDGSWDSPKGLCAWP